ncbi:MAG: polysaccharide biosynthesis protein [Rickettsiales bacterium]|nr:polysaccharide biosynthesis protein [Rickettsiales bacterium]
MKKMFNYYSDKYLASWIIKFLDLIVVFVGFVLASLLRFNFEVASISLSKLLEQSLITCAVYLVIFSLSKTSDLVMRHTSFTDIHGIFKAVVFSLAILIGMDVFLYEGMDYTGIFLIPKSILIIQALLVMLGISGYRLAAKSIYATFLNSSSALKSNVLIVGADVSSLMTKSTLLNSSKHSIRVIGHVDNHPKLQGKKLDGSPVFQLDNVINSSFLKEKGIDEIIISDATLGPAQKRAVIDSALQYNIKVREVPPHEKWVNGELTENQIKPVRIEDLLGRSEIKLDSINIQNELQGKTVLVTGGAGSIGSEIVRQALFFKPKKVIALDQGETPCYELGNTLKKLPEDIAAKCEIVIADITHFRRMQQIFSKYKPDLVFHAAAYKHVPLMENNASEAVETNVFGTKNIADLALRYKVQKFVMVSTDKAINPTNVMGASKRVAEIYVQALNSQQNSTHYIVTRFGNVLGSNGSVIPLFQKQIEKGGPITITHKDITRYFMTISEACNLVLEAGSIGNGGEIFVFDMGESVKILDLAKKMIQLSGLQEGKDIDIEFVGLRPGEKLYEELLAVEENTLSTHHPKIMRAQIQPVVSDEVKVLMDRLHEKVLHGDDEGVVGGLKQLVPEYISKNSVYSRLDKKSSQAYA